EQPKIEAEAFQYFLLRLWSKDGPMMAMEVDQGFAVELQLRIIRHVFAEELAQEERLFAQTASFDLVWQQILQLVAKNGRATRLEHNYGCASFDLRSHGLENVAQPFFGRI